MGFPTSKSEFAHLYGPVASWRLGSSLGVDVLSAGPKVCPFDCVYCQLGSMPQKPRERKLFVPTQEILDELRRFHAPVPVDYITFSGNGEPTLASNLGELIARIPEVRDEKIAVITNAALMDDAKLRAELSGADIVLAKFDAATGETFRKINRPLHDVRWEALYEGLRLFRKSYKGRYALQMMFVEENYREYRLMAEKAFALAPDEIEINTPLRPCGVKPLSKERIKDITRYFVHEVRRTGLSCAIRSVYQDDRDTTVSPLDREATKRRRGDVR